ncbi:family 78 glycoside hydrolase catalytic domain [Saccharicrinis sp. GN24d3]|uniref:family 78 glycoside hydrolase catalytic domain n=1 Tax=Saccharicrinis sp. GN24d3 TaxID=3458416 RepID=UPI0040366AF9
MMINHIKVHLVKNIFFVCLLLGISVFFQGCKGEESQFEITSIQTQFITNIDNHPVFSWQTKSNVSDFMESSVQVIIANNRDDIERNVGNVWDSGKIETRNNSRLKYNGPKLDNGSLFYAKMKVWDNKGNECAWSKSQQFCIPIEYPKDWNAKWITYDYNIGDTLPVFKRIIEIPNKKEVNCVKLYIAAPGFYEAFLNGNKVGENVLDPGQTNYEDYTYYTVYDLDIDVHKKYDVLGVMLGNGWYNQNVVWGKGMRYGQPVFVAQVVIHYKNGVKIIIGSDESWTWKNGPIIFSNIYAGETYDANSEVNDWFATESSDDAWKKASLSEIHPTKLYEQFAETIQRMDSIQAKGVIAKNDGKYIFDFGQNFAGWVKLDIEGKKGQEITMRCVEELDENGEIDPRSTGIRATKVIQTQKYICNGQGNEVWEPKFTYFGFRFVEVEGLTTKPSKDLLKGIVVYSSLPVSGQFNCSEMNINKLHNLATWTLKSNIHGIPTDCPHREKCGWTGDAHALINALAYNYDCQKFISKYIFDMRSSARRTNNELYFGTSFHDRSMMNKPVGVPTMIVPGKRTSGTASPDWGTAMTQLPWAMYMYYGDMVILNNFYPDMKVWVDYVNAKNENGIITHGLGDWCPPGGNQNIDCPVPISSTAYHILDLNIMAQTAKILGVTKDYEHYKQLHKSSVESFNKQFLDTTNYTYGSQTANVMALSIGIVPENSKQKVAASIVRSLNAENNGFIKTGIFGFSRLFQVLAENGFEDEVYRLIHKKGENSFAFMWDNFDATTLWEVLPIRSLDSEELFYRSHSHPMQAGYDAWFYNGIGGINPSQEKPGFKKIVFKPYLTKYLKNAEASYKSAFGIIKSVWSRNSGNFSWEIQIPDNSTGEIFVPNYQEKVDVSINGEAVQINDYSSDFTSLGEMGSGSYLIKMSEH